jgi:hypothetical protein
MGVGVGSGGGSGLGTRSGARGCLRFSFCMQNFPRHPRFLIFVFRCRPAPLALALALVLHLIQRGTLLASRVEVGVVVLCAFCSRSVPVPVIVVFSFDSVPCTPMGCDISFSSPRGSVGRLSVPKLHRTNVVYRTLLDSGMVPLVVRDSTPCIRIGQVLCYFSTSTRLST